MKWFSLPVILVTFSILFVLLSLGYLIKSSNDIQAKTMSSSLIEKEEVLVKTKVAKDKKEEIVVLKMHDDEHSGKVYLAAGFTAALTLFGLGKVFVSNYANHDLNEVDKLEYELHSKI